MNFAYQLCCRVAAGARVHRLFREPGPYVGLILMLHRVARKGEIERHPFTEDLWATEEKLDQALGFFQGLGYQIASLDEARAACQRGKTARPMVVFTFDDGFLDNYELAYPIFRKRQQPATFYITSSLPDGGLSAWPYALEDLVLRERGITYQFEGATDELRLATFEEKRAGYAQIRDRLLGLPPGKFEAFATGLFGQSGLDLAGYTRRSAVTWDQLRVMAADPLITIGGHTANHFMLSRLTSEQAAAEIEQGQRRLETELHQKVRHFAYPYGCKPPWENADVEMAKRFGLATSVTTLPGYLCPEHTGHLASLPRLQFGERTSLPQLEVAFKRLMDRLSGRPRHFMVG
jgi:peptidoglycan/xylan/chitin deacetylase (PgdA/CDA1 family)